MTLFMNLHALWSFFLVTLLALDICVLAQHGLSQSQRREIRDAHNLFRSTVDPSATNMLKMLWNDELARVAQNHANRCIFEHSQNRASQAPSFATVGENLFVTSAQTMNYTAVVKAWYNEVMYYDYDLNSCSVECRQYTQVVWAHTNMVGCGVAQCARVQNFPAPDSFLLVCNYVPEGNTDNERPYRAGTPCSQCPANTDFCRNNLCKVDVSPTTPTSEAMAPSRPLHTTTTQPTAQPTPQPEPVQTTSATTDNNSNGIATSPTSPAPEVDEEPPVAVEESEESNGRSRSRARTQTRARTRTRTRMRTRTRKQSRMRTRSRVSGSGRSATKTGKNKKKGSRRKQNTD